MVSSFLIHQDVPRVEPPKATRVEPVRAPRDPSEGMVLRIAVALGFIGLLASYILGIGRDYGFIVFVAIVLGVVAIGIALLVTASHPTRRSEVLSHLRALLAPAPRRDDEASSVAEAREVTITVVSVTCPNCGTSITAVPPSSKSP